MKNRRKGVKIITSPPLEVLLVPALLSLHLAPLPHCKWFLVGPTGELLQQWSGDIGPKLRFMVRKGLVHDQRFLQEPPVRSQHRRSLHRWQPKRVTPQHNSIPRPTRWASNPIGHGRSNAGCKITPTSSRPKAISKPFTAPGENRKHCPRTQPDRRWMDSSMGNHSSFASKSYTDEKIETNARLANETRRGRKFQA